MLTQNHNLILVEGELSLYFENTYLTISSQHEFIVTHFQVDYKYISIKRQELVRKKLHLKLNHVSLDIDPSDPLVYHPISIRIKLFVLGSNTSVPIIITNIYFSSKPVSINNNLILSKPDVHIIL